MKILVTGATGFVGSRLCPALAAQGIDVLAISRRGDLYANEIDSASERPRASASVTQITVGDLAAYDWVETLAKVDVVIHLAGRAHRTSAADSETYLAYHNDNVVTTTALAKACIAAGVRRFVFVSSVKVLGERSLESPFSETDTPHPEDVYGITKLEAERELTRLGSERSLQVVIIRPPLVYGPGVRANFLRLMKLVNRGLPLPFKNANNMRSMVFLDNLVSSLIACAIDRRASGIYLVCDRELLSVRSLLEELARALNKKLRLFDLPKGLLETAAAAIGREDEVRRLFSPLVVSAEKIARELDWAPPFSAFEGLATTARAFMQSRNRGEQVWER